MGCFLLSVLWCDFLKKQIFPLFCSNHKTLSRLELNFKRRLVVVDVRFENWGISLGWYSRISPSSIRGIFGHVISLDQSRASNDIIINIYIYIYIYINSFKNFFYLSDIFFNSGRLQSPFIASFSTVPSVASWGGATSQCFSWISKEVPQPSYNTRDVFNDSR